MIVPVDLHKDIYEKLAQEAEAKGLTCHELIRVILGEHVSFMIPKFVAPYSPAEPAKDKIALLGEMLIIKMIASGDLKCPHCTMSISLEAIETGICNKCGNKILGKEKL